MYKSSFDVQKMKRFISRYGAEFVFKRYEKNEFGEPSSEFEEFKIFGVFHENNSYITKNVSDGTVARNKPQPQILTLVNENNVLKIGDITEYRQSKFQVTELNNVNNLSVAFDISLEVIDDGTGFGC
jgi:hypothetical protein